MAATCVAMIAAMIVVLATTAHAGGDPEAMTASPRSTVPAQYQPLYGRVVVNLSIIGGVANLNDGPELGIGTGATVWTTLSGFGLYGSYSALERVSFGAGGDFVGAHAIDIDTPQGTYTARYQGARLFVDTTLHTGRTARRLVPYARARFGLITVVHDFERDNVIEVEYRAAGLITLGGGADWFLSPHFSLGLGISANIPVFGQETGLALEANLRVGWAFDRAE